MQIYRKIFLLLLTCISCQSLHPLQQEGATSQKQNTLSHELQQTKKASSATHLDKDTSDNLQKLTTHKEISSTKKLQEEIASKDTNDRKITLKHVICGLVIIGACIAAPYALAKYLKCTITHAAKLLCFYAIPTLVGISISYDIYADCKAKQKIRKIELEALRSQQQLLEQEIAHNKKMWKIEKRMRQTEKAFMKEQKAYRKAQLEDMKKELEEQENALTQKRTFLQICTNCRKTKQEKSHKQCKKETPQENQKNPELITSDNI